MNREKFTAIQILSVVLLICSFTVPMFELWQGILPSKNAWNAAYTFEALKSWSEGRRYVAELLHLNTWIPAILLLIAAFAKKKWGIILTSGLGIILPAKVLVEKIIDLYDYDEFWYGLEEYMNFDDGNICIGYYICLILFIICLITACTINEDMQKNEAPNSEQSASAEKINVRYFCRQCGNELTANDELCPKCLCCFKIHIP